ncbi:cubilin-like [Eriocheir sinensis]|uniref:cubilin-like n=1 Tax=Eriocheir sinensis TaxID=95602 RepID=UPI0021C89815|nr:cubilin-like [Eriocheir sinensis]
MKRMKLFSTSRLLLLFLLLFLLLLVMVKGAANDEADGAEGEEENTHELQAQETNDEELEEAQNVEEPLPFSVDAEEVKQDSEVGMNSYLDDSVKNSHLGGFEESEGDSEGGFLQDELKDLLKDGSPAAFDNGLTEGNEVDAGDQDPVGDAILEFIDSFIEDPVEPVHSKSADVDERKQQAARNYHDEVVANLTRLRTPEVGEEGESVEVVSCGGFITLSHDLQQVITTPGFPAPYPANVQCVWTIVAQLGTDSDQVHLWIAEFELEEGSCRADSLRIVDNLVGSSIEFCGTNNHRWVTSRGNSLTLTFTSDATVQRRGFLIRVFGIRSTCGGVIQTLGQSHSVHSTPNYPLPYPVASRCHWLVLAKSEMALSLVGHHGDPEKQGALRISTEPFGEYEVFDPSKVYLSDIFSFTFTASPNKVEDSQRPGLQFQLVPTVRATTCNTTVTVKNDSAAVIASSKYPHGYERYEKCWWTLRYEVSEEYRATLHFVDFDMENGRKCFYDYLEIIDKRLTAAERLCGEKSGFEYATDSRELLLYFQSDAYNMASHRGFLLLGATERIRKNECTVHRSNNVTVVFSSPPSRPQEPTYSICNYTFSTPAGGRFAVRFIHFSMERSQNCAKGSHLAVEESGVRKREYYCGEKTGVSFLTAGNLLTLHYYSNDNDPTQRVQVEIREVHDTGCGGNHVLRPGQTVDLRTPSRGPLERDCVWVVRGRESLLLLSFKNVRTEVKVSQTGLYSNTFTYGPRTLHFIDPSENYMILSREEGVTITVTAYAIFSHCGSILRLGSSPVIVTNLGVAPCSQIITTLGAERVTSVSSIQYTLLSAGQPDTCSLEVIDKEEGVVIELCSDDWKRQYETSSTRLKINAIESSSNSEPDHSYLVLVAAVTTSCGDTFDVKDRVVVVKSRNMEKNATCVYRFVGDRTRMVLDVATSSRRALSYLSVSSDGYHQTLKDLSLLATTSIETTREFLVVVRPFPKSVSFVIQVTRVSRVFSPCDTCIILERGDQGIVTSPHSPDLPTYPGHLFCNVKFEAEDRNRSVVLEVQELDLPRNTSLDALSVLKDGVATVISPSRVAALPFTLVLDTPFILRFKTTTHNEFEGYRIHYDANDCGGTVTLTEDWPVTIRSPASWGLYPTYTRCVWFVEANALSISDRIKLKVVKFDVDESDFVEVFDPLQSSAPVAILRGAAAEGVTVRSIGHQLRVVFWSDSRRVSSGFVLKVRAVVSGCGGDIDTGLAAEGTISTHSYFPDNEYCLFRLRPTQGHVVSLTPIEDTNSNDEDKKLSEGSEGYEGESEEEGEEEEPVWVDGKCRKGKVVVSTSGVLRDGVRYCVGEAIPTVHSTNDVLLLVEAPPIPPISFAYRVGGCGGEMVGAVGQLTSPNHPEPFIGPLTCVWTSRVCLLVTVTHLDLDPHLDRLLLSDPTRATTLTGTKRLRRVLEAPGSVTFTGGSVGVRTGFHLHYECVSLQKTWQVTAGSPAVILGWHSGPSEPRVWQVTAGEPARGLVVRVWGAYIPGGPTCEKEYLQVTGTEGEGERVCGGAVLRTLHLYTEELTLLLHTSSTLAGFAATVHLMA